MSRYFFLIMLSFVKFKLTNKKSFMMSEDILIQHQVARSLHIHFENLIAYKNIKWNDTDVRPYQ